MEGLGIVPTLDDFKTLMKEDVAFNEHFSAFLQLPVSDVLSIVSFYILVKNE